MNSIDFNSKKILITGGAGFIGSNIAKFISTKFPKSDIYVFDCFRNETKLSNGNLSSFGHYKNLIDFKGTIITGNLNNKLDIENLKQYKFDYIFHQAAISDTRVYDQELIFRTNINSFYDLLDISIESGAVLIYASSASVYGNLPAPQVIGSESPENPYAYSKYSMDKIAEKFSNKYPELKIIGLRFFNVYGENEYFKNKTASMVIQLGHQIMSGKAPRLFENSNNIFRDFVYIDDVVDANIKACSAKRNGVYNVGSGVARSFQDISDILQKELKVDLGNEYFKNPYDGYQSNTQADISLTENFLSYKPKFSLEEGIRKYLPYIEKMYQEEI